MIYERSNTRQIGSVCHYTYVPWVEVGRTAFMKGGIIAKGSTTKAGAKRCPHIAHTRNTLNTECGRD